MIDIDTWPLAVKLPFLIMPFVIALSGVAMSAHVTLTRDYKMVCSSITSNPCLEILKVAWGSSSFKWRFFLVCAIAGLVTFPGVALRRHQLDADELKAFSPKLKRRLAVSVWLTIIGAGWMTFAALVIKVAKMN